MSDLFDPTSFLNSPMADANATRRDPLPAGETFGTITKLDMAHGTSDRGPWRKLNISIEIGDPAYLTRADRQKAVVTYGLMLDLTDTGTISMGPNVNVRLGKLREATGVNQPGKALTEMVGRPIKVIIGHRPDANDPSVMYDEVKAVAKY